MITSNIKFHDIKKCILLRTEDFHSYYAIICDDIVVKYRVQYHLTNDDGTFRFPAYKLVTFVQKKKNLCILGCTDVSAFNIDFNISDKQHIIPLSDEESLDLWEKLL